MNKTPQSSVQAEFPPAHNSPTECEAEFPLPADRVLPCTPLRM
eukprot:CAMPEP_0171103176 /NCGR_PEP_ID=MMETSP0766_2-20121228/58780_1 /TAXON_ID=439317 /ORGANISM="Gambierdiscus australes, Strain CAWD 149" /LENGTH=42 /DNA_ID= /DNA_START= /DNA_END= /DNA_ORIENTATION=